MSELSNRLRLASTTAEYWDDESMSYPPIHDWADLMEQAADALEALEGDVEEAEKSTAAFESLERLARSE